MFGQRTVALTHKKAKLLFSTLWRSCLENWCFRRFEKFCCISFGGIVRANFCPLFTNPSDISSMILSKYSFGSTTIGFSFCHCCYAVKDCSAVGIISFDIVEKVYVYWNDICLKMGTLVTNI